MKKSFKKGFVMAETIVVSIVVLTALVIIYTQFISINNSYYRSFRYNTIDDLFAVNNVKEFIEKDSLNNIVSNMKDKNYLDLTSCSTQYFKEYNYCKTLLEYLNIKTLLFTYEDVTNLKNELKQNNLLSEGLRSFVKTISANKNNKYRLIVEFNDDRYATLKIGSFIVSNLSNECVKEGNTCTIETIKSGVFMDVAVNDNETYRFNVIKDDGSKLTLIMNDNFSDNIYWDSNSNTSGPNNLLNYLDARVKNWDNVLDITYNLNGNNSDNYNGCSSYNACEDNIYNISTKNSKARLPMLQDLTNLGCSQIAGSCPSWLGNNLNTSDSVGYWTSTANSSNVWIISYDNRLNTTSVNTDNIKIRPVIIINKNVID